MWPTLPHFLLRLVVLDWGGSSQNELQIQLSNEKRAPGWLGYVEDFTTQLYTDYHESF